MGSGAGSPIGRVLVACARGVRTGWLLLGIAVAMLLIAEVVGRVAAGAKHALHPTGSARVVARTDTPPHPYADSAWWPVLQRELNGVKFRWEPYLYDRVARTRGRYVNEDGAGERYTPRIRRPGGRPLRVLLFGGSSMWGFFERDSSTRAAVLERRLASTGFDAEVVNLGQHGYVLAQEVLDLVMRLRRGDSPDAVVFWDGANDVIAMRSNGQPGESMTESERADDAAFGSIRRRHEDVFPARLATRYLLLKSYLFQKLSGFAHPPLVLPPPSPPGPFCRSLMGDWVQLARQIDRLAAAYHFTALVVWQPQWATSGRPVSAYEKRVAAQIGAGVEDGLVAHRRECARLADSLVVAGAARSILNFAAVHTGDTATVFLDRLSHSTEYAAAVEADTLATVLLARLRADGVRPTGATAARLRPRRD
jgi:hypothetical protein